MSKIIEIDDMVRPTLKISPELGFMIEGYRIEPSNWFTKKFWKFIRFRVELHKIPPQLVTSRKAYDLWGGNDE